MLKKSPLSTSNPWKNPWKTLKSPVNSVEFSTFPLFWDVEKSKTFLIFTQLPKMRGVENQKNTKFDLTKNFQNFKKNL